MTEFERFCREAAAARGIHPDTAVLVFGNEGGFDRPEGNIGEFPTGTSYWAPQLHYAGGIDPKAGLGDDFTKLTGWQPGDPRAWRDALRYALNVAKKDGWRQWYAAAKVGVDRWSGIDRSAPWDANAETWDYERPTEQPMPDAKTTTTNTDDVNFRAGPGTSFDKLHAPLKQGSTVWLTDAPPVTAEGHTWRQVALGLVGWVAAEFLQGMPASGDSSGDAPRDGPAAGLQFNPDTPTELQRQDFSCSIRAATWCLKSVGVDIDAGQLEDEMVPTYVSRALGLLDARGYGFAEILKRYLPADMHDRVHVFESIAWDQLGEIAGRGPVALGGRNWGGPGLGHWVGIRGPSDDGSFRVMQPGGTGLRFGQQYLTREMWDRMGPFSAVWVDAR